MSSFFTILLLVVLPGLFSFIYLLRSLRHRQPNNGHPLPPGPRPWPVLGSLHILGSLPHHTLHRLSKKYGPIMHIRLGFVPTIVVSSPQLAELFLKTHDIIFASRPKTQASKYMSYGTKGMSFTPYGSYWRNIRKLCTIHLLSKSKLDSFRPMRRDEVGRLVKSLKGAAEDRKVVDLSAKVGSVIEEMTYKMLLGMSSNDSLNFKPVIQEVMKLGGAFNLADYIPFIGLLDLQGLGRRMKAANKVFDKMLDKIIDDHAQGTNNVDGKEHNKDFVDVMLSLIKSNEKPLDRDNIKAILLDILAGSMDTSSNVIEWALSELLRHLKVMKRVQQELTSVIGLDHIVEEADLAKLEYLEKVVKETMRLHPPGPLLVPHESMEDIVINGYHVRKKSRVIVNVWSIGRDPDTWSGNAEDFVPERFNARNTDVRGNDFELLPFGSGRRGCPGIEMGLTTVRLVLAQLVHCFEWELPDGMSPSELDMNEVFGLAVPRAIPLLADQLIDCTSTFEVTGDISQ